MSGFHFVAWMVPLVVLMGCASSPQQTERPGRVVVGSGTDDDRSVISSSNQQIYGAEHALSPDAQVVTRNPTPTPTAVPGPSAAASPAATPSSAPPASATASPTPAPNP